MFPTNGAPFYKEVPITLEELKEHYVQYNYIELQKFLESIQPKDKLFKFTTGTRGGGRLGYYRLTESGETITLNESTWLS